MRTTTVAVPRRRPSRRRSRPLLPWLAVVVGAVTATLLFPAPRGPAPAPPAATSHDRSVVVAPVAAVTEPLQRTEVRPPSPPPTAPARSFADYVDELVRIGLATSRLAAAGDEAGAQDSDARARELFGDMLRHVADADEQALAAIMAMSPPARTSPSPQLLRWAVLTLCIDAGLQQRLREFQTMHDRRHLDQLAGGLLALLPLGERFAVDFGERRLVDQPYLGAAHEATVLQLAELAAEGRFPIDLATALLLTAWRNMVAEGVRGKDELCHRALLLLTATNPCLRAAAGQLLLREPRLREVVLQQVLDGNDRALAGQLALAAATDLPAADALAVLRRLQGTGADLLAAFLALGERDGAALTTAYQQALAADVEPQFRAELVSAVGFSGTPQAVENARLAFDKDPSPEVRKRAMFALTANAADALGEATLERAIDDATARGDARLLGAVVLALENLARAGQINAVDRLGQRLRVATGLLPLDRDNLERILERTLPGGATSR